jgi:DNA polymerase III subunit gamma/tau
MSYKVLARAYRPQKFDDIIGQQHIALTLKNAILENRVAHAYLFSGPRGVGKTTTARVFAKAINCKDRKGADPDGKCVNCTEITGGISVDVQEIDGASNRGIDEIRTLRDNAKFAPVSSKYKIYIIDEAHQITDAAFNALLKTLEEPPEHVIFILATTEPQKIPITILSRCQRYQFRLLSSKEIIDTLGKIAQKEKFDIDDEALAMIATASGGSLRDALSITDQAVSSGQDKITGQSIIGLLGFLPADIIYSTAQAVSKNDGAKILDIVKSVTEQGYNLLQFGRDLREHFRKTLIAKINSPILEVNEDERKALEKQKELFSSSWLIRSSQLLSKCLDEMRWSDQPRLVMELYLLKIAEPYVAADELVKRLEKLEVSGPDSGFEPEPAPEVKRQTAPQTKPQVSAPAPVEKPVTYSKPVEPAGTKTHSLEEMKAIWNSVTNDLRIEKPLVGSVLEGVEFCGASDGSMMIGVTSKFQQDGIKRNQAVIESAVANKFGRSFRVNMTILEKKAEPAVTVTADEIIVEEENNAPVAQELYKVEGNSDKPKDPIPSSLDKILGKFPGRVSKKQ